MTELIIMTAIICVTIAFCVFVFCAVWSSKIKNKTILDGDHDFIDREEFEEYEDIIKSKFDIIDMHIKDLESRDDSLQKFVSIFEEYKHMTNSRLSEIENELREKK